MEKTITASEANRKFSALLRGVRAGDRYVITSHGKPVAHLSEAKQESEADLAKRRAVFEQLTRRIRERPAMNIGHVTRDEMHER